MTLFGPATVDTTCKESTVTTTITNQQQQQKQQRQQRQGQQQQQHKMIAYFSREKNGSKSFQYGAEKESIGYCDRAGAHLKREKSLKLKLVQTKRFVLLILRYFEVFCSLEFPTS